MSVPNALAKQGYLLFSGVMFALAGAYLLRGGPSSVRLGLRLWRSDPVTVEEAATADGTVELQGTAVAGEAGTVSSPFQRVDCLACEYDVQRYSSSTQGSGDWKTLAAAQRGVAFGLADDTGTILVDPANARLSLSEGDHVGVGPMESPPEHVAEAETELREAESSGTMLEFGPISVESMGTGATATAERRRYRERRLEPGDTVHVFGPVESDSRAARAGEPDDVAAAVRDPEGSATFVVSDAAAGGTVRRHVLDGLKSMALGLPVLGVGLGLLAWGGLRAFGVL